MDERHFLFFAGMALVLNVQVAVNSLHVTIGAKVVT
jgi:hypothetical protein